MEFKEGTVISKTIRNSRTENEKIDLILSYAERLNQRYGKENFIPLPKFENKGENNNDNTGN